MSDTQPNGRTATLSDIASLRDDFREDLAAAEARLRDAIAAVDTKVTQALNHQHDAIAAASEAVREVREKTVPALRERIVRLEARWWYVVLAAVVGSALPGVLERAIRWFAG